MKLSAARINRLFRKLTLKEAEFKYQLDYLRILSFENAFNSESKEHGELRDYIKTSSSDEHLNVNYKFMKLLYDKSMVNSFQKNRQFPLNELSGVCSYFN